MHHTTIKVEIGNKEMGTNDPKWRVLVTKNTKIILNFMVGKMGNIRNTESP